MTKYKYKHESLYFKDEDISLLDTLKDEAIKNNMNFSDYIKELVRVGRDKGIYSLPESVKVVDQSGKIKDLESQIEKIKSDMIRLSKLKESNFDWNSILRALTTDSYITERQILERTGKIKKSLFIFDDNETGINEEHVELQIADLQQKLCLRAEYFKDVQYKPNQGWKLCKN